MKHTTIFLTAVFGACCLNAQQDTTAFTIAKKVSVPGATLKPGNYSLRMLDHLPGRYVLELDSADDFKTITTFLAVPDPTLPQLPEGQPVYWDHKGDNLAIRGMWTAGVSVGLEFVFPKAEAADLAKKTGRIIPAVDPASEGKKDVAKMDDQDRQVVGLWLLTAVAVAPNGRETGIAATKYVPAPTETVSTKLPPEKVVRIAKATKTQTMPKTAGNFAGFLLGGMAAATAGLLLLRLNFRPVR